MFDPTEHITTLKAYRDELNAIIAALESLGTHTGAVPKKRGRPANNRNILPMPATTTGKRRGRPPANKPVVESNSIGFHRKVRTFSKAQRAEQAARMKKYWAAKRRAAKAVAATA